MPTTDELRAEIEARGGTVPTEGSGKDGAVLKADLEEALAALPADEPVADEVTLEDLGFTRSMNGSWTRTN